jgi:hypothetical protein
MKKLIVPLMLGFGVVMAVLIGQRMSTDAMAVVIGVAVGVTASVPTSLLLVALLRRERNTYRGEAMQPPGQPPYYPQLQQPNVIVLDPSQFGARQAHDLRGHVPLPPPTFEQDAGLRRLRVVGNENDWDGVN